MAQLAKAWIEQRKEITADLFKVWLRPELPFSFKPGQYITIGKDGTERPYSIASAPHEAAIELFIEHVLSAYGGKLTPTLWRLKVGDFVSMRPEAKGRFLFRPEFHHHVMVGTTTGIAPFVSMVRHAIHKAIQDHRFYVMQGASHQDEFGYDAEFRELAGECPGLIRYVATVSRPSAEPNGTWDGPTGRVNLLVEQFLDRWHLPKDDTLIYLCGNPGMIEDVARRLDGENWNLEAERYWTEKDSPLE